MTAVVVVKMECDGCFIFDHVHTPDRMAARAWMTTLGWKYDPVDETDFCPNCQKLVPPHKIEEIGK
jgi:hypothetical protein